MATRARRQRGGASGLTIPTASTTNQTVCRSHLAEANFEAALADVSPLVDAATAAGDFTRAASYLATILQIEEAHRDSLQKMAEVREAEGNAPEAARLRLALAREDERRGNVEAAIEATTSLETLNAWSDAVVTARKLSDIPFDNAN